MEFFFSEFRKRRFRKKKSRAKIFGKGFKGFFSVAGLGFSPTKTSEVLLADAVFGHSHFCDASETWIFHWKFLLFFFRRKVGLLEDLVFFWF